MTEKPSYEANSKDKHALLEEYQACIQNRNHYDTIIWIIGSIFLAASLTLFGLSFDKDGLFWDVLLMAFFSSALMVIWFLYVSHVTPYVMMSLVRLHEIELKLYRLKLDIRLNYEIHMSTNARIKGFQIFAGISLLLFFAWFSRLIYQAIESFVQLEFIFIIIYALTLSALLVLEVNSLEKEARKYRNRIEQIVKKRGKLEEEKVTKT